MITHEELHDARDDLADMLAEVLTSVFAEEALTDRGLPPALGGPGPVGPPGDPGTSPDGKQAVAHLAILDEVDGTYLGIEVRTGTVLARMLAWRMFTTGEPTCEDVLDAIGELGNIAAGNVKSLLFSSARLSLPRPFVQDARDAQGAPAGPRPGGGEPAPEAVTVNATVLGQVVELVLVPLADPDGLTWPPTMHDDVLETQS